MDPNYRHCLSPQQQAVGRETVVKVALHLEQLKRRTVVEIDTSTNSADMFSSEKLLSATTSATIASSNDGQQTLTPDRNSFESFLDEETAENNQTGLSGLLPCLTVLESFTRQNIPVRDVIPKYPVQLQEAAWVLTALPPTQVSVERLFSALRILVSDLRSTLGPDVVEAILLLRTNGY